MRFEAVEEISKKKITKFDCIKFEISVQKKKRIILRIKARDSKKIFAPK